MIFLINYELMNWYTIGWQKHVIVGVKWMERGGEVGHLMKVDLWECSSAVLFLLLLLLEGGSSEGWLMRMQLRHLYTKRLHTFLLHPFHFISTLIGCSSFLLATLFRTNKPERGENLNTWCPVYKTIVTYMHAMYLDNYFKKNYNFSL